MSDNAQDNIEPQAKRRPPHPGQKAHSDRLKEILRVDHAGELAAIHIYKAQARVFQATKYQALAENFADKQAEETIHFERFETLMRQHQVRPTVMTPVWRIAALGLGGVTALMGEKCAHACTEAVETVIEAHYAEQVAELKVTEPELAIELEKFRQDEMAHRDEAIKDGAHQAPAYPLLRAIITSGCKLAIKISEKI